MIAFVGTLRFDWRYCKLISWAVFHDLSGRVLGRHAYLQETILLMAHLRMAPVVCGI